MPPSEQEALKSTCERIVSEDWSATLRPHLTARTAWRHVFLHEEILEISGFCRGIINDFIQKLLANPSLKHWMWGTPSPAATRARGSSSTVS